jgi:hypothetical protein
MLYYNDPEEMTPEERFKEIAAILAAGYLHLKKRTPYLPDLVSDITQEADLPDPPVHMPIGKETFPVYQETT